MRRSHIINVQFKVLTEAAMSDQINSINLLKVSRKSSISSFFSVLGDYLLLRRPKFKKRTLIVFSSLFLIMVLGHPDNPYALKQVDPQVCPYASQRDVQLKQAQWQGDPEVGGYAGPGPIPILAIQVPHQAEGSWYTLRGQITRQLGQDKYLFEDMSGASEIKIDDQVWEGQIVTAADLLEIQCEATVEKGRNLPMAKKISKTRE